MCILATAFWKFMEGWVYPSPRDGIQTLTTELIQYSVAEGSSRIGCVNLLHNLMRRNNNHYAVKIIGIWGNGASPAPGTGTISSTVQIIFPDGTRLEVETYGGFPWCHVPADKEDYF
jgi:hypothetical protein